MTIELSTDRLRKRCDPNLLEFDTTADVKPASGIIGQQRAVESLRFGLAVQNPSFHVFVAGPPGTGRTTAVETFLHDLAKDQAVASDWCYVNNFTDTSRPLGLRVEAGIGRALAADVNRLIARARDEVPKAMDTEEYQRRRHEIKYRLESRRQVLVEELSEEAGEDFLVSAGPLGVMVTPLVGGRPLTEELSRSLSPMTLQEVAAKQEAFAERVKRTLRQMRTAAQEAEEATEALNREVVEFAVGGLVDDLDEEYRDKGAVSGYLQDLREALTADEDLFSRASGEHEEFVSLAAALSDFDLRRYQVNVLVDRDGEEGAPVVVESNPTYGNLFGAIEREARFGALHTDFTLIKPGALHRANGGYLVLPARDLLLNFLSYDALKRALRTRELDIEEPSERLGLTSTRTLRPAPIPLNVKVVLIGTPLIYHLLYVLDEDFPKLFKVKAQFDDRMNFDEGAIRDYAAFLAALSVKECLLPLEREAVAAIVEQASRLADDQTKLATRFDEIADVVREAAQIAVNQEASNIQRKHVNQAIENRIWRSNLVEERLREMVDRGVLHIQTTGEAVGQINGLSVVDLGDYSFGRPNRITASVSLGQAGVIDIEREAKLGGPVHTKGVMILSGYLADRFAHDHPLSLSARVVFEQTYGGVEGDSASAGELLALVSRLSGVPIRQGVAITGAVDQHGRLQAVSGLNEKIEGFFGACRSQGLDGSQGVVIPASNQENLMLQEDVIEAVREQQFHVWAVETIEAAVEVTMGRPVGLKEGDSPYPEGSVYRLVDDRLREMAESLRRFASQEPYELNREED
jgi:lon-related putative ATP-dependent protease